MEKTLDLGFVLKNHEKKHKSKPSHIESVAGGVKKRLETNLKYRKSCRLTGFDNARDLTRNISPLPIEKSVDDLQTKIEQRRKRLEKWKEEKDLKRKEIASQKKKPFVAGIVHAPLKFVPPPPPKPVPSTSGRVTRSQSARNAPKKVEPKPKASVPKSFAPKNAEFKPPQIKNASALPHFIPFKQKETKPVTITFNPVLPKNKTTAKPKTKKAENNVRSTRNRQVIAIDKTSKGKISKASPKKSKNIIKPVESTSESSLEIKPIQHKRRTRKSINKGNRETLKETLLLPHKSNSRRSLLISSDSQESIILPTRRTPRKTDRKSLPVQYLTPKIVVPRSESNSEEKLRSPKDILILSTPESIETNISPCVTMSRGKDNARREMKKKLEEGLLDEDTSDTDSVAHFRRQLDSENQRMTSMCETWDNIYEETTLPEFVQELVLGTVGQARLLMSQKMKQFSSLVDRCAARDGNSGPLVTPTDLRGFWDMIFIQIENIDMRFKQLEGLKERNWSDDQPKPERKKPAPKHKAKKTKPSIGANSRIKEMIEAARKARKAQDSDASTVSSTLSATMEVEKTFDAGFFCVRSPVRSPLPATPKNKATLLKNVLSSEARKASSSKVSSFAILRASLLSKNVEMDGLALLEQTPKQLPSINFNATPARSILKPANDKSAKKSGKKSIKTVLFDRSDAEVADTPKQKQREATDSGMSSMDVENEAQNKENKNNRRSKLVRQEAIENSPVMTRARRKSINTPKTDGQIETKKRTARRNKVLQEVAVNDTTDVSEDMSCLTPRRSTRNSKIVEDLIDFSSPVVQKATPKRVARRRGKKSQLDV